MCKNKTNQLISHLLIILYLIVGFVPHFKAIDKIGPQFLYLAFLNMITFIYLISKGGIFKILKNTFKHDIFVYLLFLFWAWSTTSLFYAVNKAEVIIESSRIFIYIYSYINLLILLKWAKLDINKILLCFSIILGVEVLLV